MKTLQEIYEKYKGADARSGCDKGTIHSYIGVYAELFAPYRETAKSVIEVGIMGGHSLRMWEEYFSTPLVHGVDLCDQPFDGLADLRPMIAEGQYLISLLDATDPAAVDERFGDAKFDVVIDDASHAIGDQLAIYENFRGRLAPGGIYVIEDVENIDRDREKFMKLGSESTKVDILDMRHLKKRFDDVMVVITEVK